MKEDLDKLRKYLDDASSFELPSYDRLPNVALYMEQVISYVNDILSPLSFNEKQMLTSFMVNNYVKAKIIREPDKKKYSVDHLGYLLAISILKNVLSMNDIAILIDMDSGISDEKSTLYRFFRSMSSDIFKDVAGRTKNRVDRFAETYEKDKVENLGEAEKNLEDSIGLIALRMSVQATVYQLMSEALMRYLDDCSKAKKVLEEEVKEKERIEKKKERKEAKKNVSKNKKRKEEKGS